MEFGRVEPTTLPLIDFGLPPDNPHSARILDGDKPAAAAQFYVGCAKWGRKEWLGLIYPPKTTEKTFLNAYVKQFNSIELNTTFYGIPKKEQILKWKATAADNRCSQFLFCPKFSSSITHIKRLNHAEMETDRYIEAISGFGTSLGPCFLQLSDNFGPKNFKILEKYLTSLPSGLKVFVELRHPDWFADQAIQSALFDMLSELKKGVVITDASGRRDVLHMACTIPEVFIRFVGNGGAFLASDKARIDDWTIRLAQWLTLGLENIYFFLHQHDEADTPLIANYTIERFNSLLGSKLAPLHLLKSSNTLF